MSDTYRPTRLDIDLSAIDDNIRRIRSRIGLGVRLMAVVKADGYGHGAVPVARRALLSGASWLGVATVEEGVQLREAGIGAPILVLGPTTPEGALSVARFGLTQTVFTVEATGQLAEAARTLGCRVDVHIKVDSGMGRIGVRDGSALLAVADAIDGARSLRLGGVYTHLADADAPDPGYVMEQHTRFAPMLALLKQKTPGVLAHMANSAATLRYDALHLDMVRVGIALYLPPDLPDGAADGLRQAMRWVTRASYVKRIEPGETVGYGRAFTARRPTWVMTLPVGYADGYHRTIGGKGRALVRGISAPVISRVCMDQALLDVTDVPDAAAGDEVVLLGDVTGPGDADGISNASGPAISAAELGRWCGMIDYEVVLSPTGRVPRRYLEGTPRDPLGVGGP